GGRLPIFSCNCQWTTDHRLQFGAADAAARILYAFAQRDQAETELAGGRLCRRIQPLVDLVGPPGQSALDAAAVPVGAERQRAVLAALEQLSQRVLEQRQSARLVAHIADDRADQARLKG